MDKFRKRALGLCSALLASFVCEPSTQAAVLYKAENLFYKVIKFDYSRVKNGESSLMTATNRSVLENEINEILLKLIKDDLANRNKKGRIINENIAEIENNAVCALCHKGLSVNEPAYRCRNCKSYYHVACACQWVFTKVRANNWEAYRRTKMERPRCVFCGGEIPNYTPELIVPEKMYSKVKQELNGDLNQIKNPQLHPEIKKVESSLNQFKKPQLYPEIKETNNLINQIKNMQIKENSLNQFKKPQLYTKIKKTNNLLNQIKNTQINQNIILNEQINSQNGHLSGNGLLNYIKTPQINEEIANIINTYKGKFGKSGNAPNWIESVEAEKAISDIVDKGILPVRYVKMSDLNSLNLKPNGKARFFREVGANCWDIQNQSYNDNSMAIVCSQYNALESVNPFVNSVKKWYSDPTQGPAISLRATVDTLYRYIAYIKGKLDNSLSDIFKNFSPAGTEFKELYSKPCKLYQHGYLNLDGAYKYLSDTEKTELVNHIENNIKDFKLNFQWVRYMDGKTNQIQVFAAAPSLQKLKKDELANLNKSDKDFIIDVCKALMVPQFEMIGKLAAARSCALNGERFNLHVWVPGTGAFKNPTESTFEAIKVLLNNVKDYNIDVYLHRRSETSATGILMDQAMNELGLSYSKH